MPRYDGTGPRGTGPLSGGGQGYCAIVLPKPEIDPSPYGYVGLEGMPLGHACWGVGARASRCGSGMVRWRPCRRRAGRGRW